MISRHHTTGVRGRWALCLSVDLIGSTTGSAEDLEELGLEVAEIGVDRAIWQFLTIKPLAFVILIACKSVLFGCYVPRSHRATQ